MNLTASQEDALKEIGNIGVSKAAKQLSMLLYSPIKISIPKIALINPDKMTNFQDYKNEYFSFVYQKVEDDLQGYAALAFKREQANLLTVAILGKIPQLTQEETRACEQEALLEIGNIIISSCISVIVDLLAKKVQLTLPSYDENNIASLLKKLCASLPISAQEVLVISTILETEKDKLSGNLFLVLTEESTNTILMAIKGLLHDQE